MVVSLAELVKIAQAERILRRLLHRRLIPSAMALVIGPAACRDADRGEPAVGEAADCMQKGTLFVADHAPPQSAPRHLRAVHGGCEPCPKALRRGAPLGAACQSHQVCGESCCRCPRGERFFTVAACIEASCAPREAACAAALEQFGSDLCGN